MSLEMAIRQMDEIKQKGFLGGSLKKQKSVLEVWLALYARACVFDVAR